MLHDCQLSLLVDCPVSFLSSGLDSSMLSWCRGDDDFAHGPNKTIATNHRQTQFTFFYLNLPDGVG